MRGGLITLTLDQACREVSPQQFFSSAAEELAGSRVDIYVLTRCIEYHQSGGGDLHHALEDFNARLSLTHRLSCAPGRLRSPVLAPRHREQPGSGSAVEACGGCCSHESSPSALGSRAGERPVCSPGLSPRAEGRQSRVR